MRDTQDDRDAAAHRADMEQLKVERAQARSDRRAKIDAQIDKLRIKLENAIERKRLKMHMRQQQREAKIQALQTKADQSEGEIRERQEARIADSVATTRRWRPSPPLGANRAPDANPPVLLKR